MNSIISHVSMERTGRSLETSSFWDYGHLTIAANHRRGKGNRQCARRNVKRIARNGCDRAASSTMELRQKVGPVKPVGAETALYTNEDKAFYVKRMWAERLTPDRREQAAGHAAPPPDARGPGEGGPRRGPGGRGAEGPRGLQARRRCPKPPPRTPTTART